MRKLVAMVVALVIFAGCQKSEVKKTDTMDYSQIGIEHNKGLDYIFTQLKNAKASSPDGRISAVELLDIVSNNGSEFVKKNYPELKDQSLEFFNQRTSLDNSMIKKYYNARSTYATSYISDDIMATVTPSLTANQQYYISQILSAMTNGVDLATINTTFNNIENTVRNTCSGTEQPTILGALAIARSSSQYWNENYDAWAAEFGTPVSRTEKAVNWGVVGAADVAQAVAAGTATSTLLVSPFIGWTAWSIITGGSALIVSGASALIYAAK